MMHLLSRSLTIARGTGVLLNIVIGAGLLILPGLAIKQAGDNAIYAWAICAIAATPFVGVFIVLGRHYPDAGGVAAYAERAFGIWGRKCAAYLLLGAVSLGLPSIALTGGHYLADVFPGSPLIYAILLLGLAVLPHLAKGENVSKLMGLLASSVMFSIIALLIIGIISLNHIHPQETSFEFERHLAFSPFALLFFAFTGWEIGAGIGEEFSNPKRDFPIAMALSFILATGLYLVIAYVASKSDLSGHYETPFIAFVEPVFGRFGSLLVSIVAAIIVLANLSGALWGISRLVFSLARDQLLPKAFAITNSGHPVRAVKITAFSLFLVLMIYATGIITVETMIELAGQNFLVLYGIAALSLFNITDKGLLKLTALVVILIVFGLLTLLGARLFYPVCIVILTSWIHFWYAK